MNNKEMTIESRKVIFFAFVLLIVGLAQFTFVREYASYEGSPVSQGVMIEAFGFLADIFIFGIAITVYETFFREKELVTRYLEELEDYRGWSEKEASYRIFGLIKRLHKLNKYDIDLSKCYFEKVPFSENVGVGFDFKTALLYGTSFLNCNLQGSNFSEVQQIYVTNILGYITQFESIVKFEKLSLRNSKFCAHSYTHLHFINCDMNRANFSDSTFLHGYIDKINFSTLKLENTKFLTCKFRNIDFENTNFENTEFNECEFLNCKNINRITNNIKPMIQEDTNENTI